MGVATLDSGIRSHPPTARAIPHRLPSGAAPRGLRGRLAALAVLVAVAGGAGPLVMQVGPAAAAMNREAAARIGLLTEAMFCTATAAGSAAFCGH
ncbi:hypothetical protein M446_6393 [Methylobacterium sp. 4-46]|uniref:hypothetical protein n=1 Tax=unclassified Methylobacterium TaxID=2615210 RepID=UPI000152BE3C|nr:MULTISPECIES: hypothetical protein [Methylobacterium]ACA20657.1 hypothetical protein M446_6393 [Methylobacterium sp. 4-46]WFT79816.1 hypothetical protein QA634_32290 [Methylobacterium nodulans]